MTNKSTSFGGGLNIGGFGGNNSNANNTGGFGGSNNGGFGNNNTGGFGGNHLLKPELRGPSHAWVGFD